MGWIKGVAIILAADRDRILKQQRPAKNKAKQTEEIERVKYVYPHERSSK